MKRSCVWLSSLLLLTLIALSGCKDAPADAFVGHVEALTEIATQNKDDCSQMGDEMVNYLNGHHDELKDLAQRFKESGEEGIEQSVEQSREAMQKFDEVTASCRSSENVNSAILYLGYVLLHSALNSEG